MGGRRNLDGIFRSWTISYPVIILDAAAPLRSLMFLFSGAGLVVFPVVLACTSGVHAIFRGKLDTSIYRSSSVFLPAVW